MSHPVTAGTVINQGLRFIIVSGKCIPVIIPELMDCIFLYFRTGVNSDKCSIFLQIVGGADGVFCFLDRPQTVCLNSDVEIHFSPILFPKFIQFFHIRRENGIGHAKARFSRGVISVSGNPKICKSHVISGFYHFSRCIFTITVGGMSVKICFQHHVIISLSL